MRRIVCREAIVPLPDAVPYDVAATAVESYGTILFALSRRATLAPGEWVLVLGPAGRRVTGKLALLP